jgi:hypothetical protein
VARITLRVSDLTGQEITNDDEVVRLVVEYHPEYNEPITLEARPQEIDIDTIAAKDFVVLSYYAAGQKDPQPLFVHLDTFNDLFTNEQLTPDQALERAQQSQQDEARSRGRVQRRRGGGRQQETQSRRRERIDYASPEHAGKPHPGRITEGERVYVRDHLDEVNARLREQGRREIDPADPLMAERYGLQEEPVEEAEVIEETPPER